MILQQLTKKGVICPPRIVLDNTQYLTLMGSIAYGVAGESSDWDIYGWCIPHKTDIFPHLRGEIIGFGHHASRFDEYQQHHVIDQDMEYDFKIYSIIKFFQLAMENNSNVIDALFVPYRCILHSTQVSNFVRDNRRKFLHKGIYSKLKGYAFSEFKKMKSKNPEPGSKRSLLREQYGMDTKFAYNVYRLMSQCEEILATGDLTLDEEGRREVMKSIRRGEWTVDRLERYFEEKEVQLEKLYNESKLPYEPNEAVIKDMLLHCLKMHFGSIADAVNVPDKWQNMIEQIKEIVNR